MKSHKILKGEIDLTTAGFVSVKPIGDLDPDAVANDLMKAAEEVNYRGSDEELIKFIGMKSTNQTLNFKMENYIPVSFADSFSEDEKKKENFLAWSKFYSHLSKLGYKVK